MAVQPGGGTSPEPGYGAVTGYSGPPSAQILRMRAANADRDRAVDVLKAAFAEGRLTKDEYDERVEKACASRTYGELAAITDDLPVGPLGVLALAARQGDVAVPQRVRINRGAVAALILGLLPTGITSILAISMGIEARQQIKETGERGLILAEVGIALGAFFTIAIACYFFAIVMVGASAGG